MEKNIMKSGAVSFCQSVMVMVVMAVLSLAVPSLIVSSFVTPSLASVSPTIQPANPSTPTQPTPTTPTQTPEQFIQDFHDLLLGDEYSNHRTQSYWQSTKPEEKYDSDFTLSEAWERFFENLAQMTGIFGKVVLLLLLAVGVWWIIKNRQAISLFMGKYLPSHQAVAVPYLDKVDKQAFDGLPAHDKLANQIARLLEQGEYLQALSWLYQGSLRVMVMQYQVKIGHSHTEEQCQALLQASAMADGSVQAFFAKLVAIWQEAAYGKRLPAKPKERIGELLVQWRSLFVLAHKTQTPNIQPPNIQQSNQSASQSIEGEL